MAFKTIGLLAFALLLPLNSNAIDHGYPNGNLGGGIFTFFDNGSGDEAFKSGGHAIPVSHGKRTTINIRFMVTGQGGQCISEPHSVRLRIPQLRIRNKKLKLAERAECRFDYVLKKGISNSKLKKLVGKVLYPTVDIFYLQETPNESGGVTLGKPELIDSHGYHLYVVDPNFGIEEGDRRLLVEQNLDRDRDGFVGFSESYNSVTEVLALSSRNATVRDNPEFDHYDLDGNGRIDKKDAVSHQNLYAELFVLNDRNIIRNLDQDRDGVVGNAEGATVLFEEISALIGVDQGRGIFVSMSDWDLISHLDVDYNGEIDSGDLAVHEEVFRALF